MSKSLLVLFVLGTAVFSAPVRAQSAAGSSNAVVDVKQKLMYVGGFEGWSLGVKLYQNGNELEFGFFGANAGKYFAESPEALEEAEGAATWKAAGLTLHLIGMVAVGLGGWLAGHALAQDDRATFMERRGAILGSLCGGIAVGTAGVLMLQRSRAKLVRALNIYNAHLMNRHLPPGEKVDFGLFLSRDTAGAGLALNF